MMSHLYDSLTNNDSYDVSFSAIRVEKMLTSSTLFINVKNVQISHSPAAKCPV